MDFNSITYMYMNASYLLGSNPTRPVTDSLHCLCNLQTQLEFFLHLMIVIIIPRGEWAGPGGTAIPGQPVAKAEQAPDTSPSSKNQFNIVVLRWRTYQILS